MITIDPCTHGSPAKYVTVIDRHRITDRDPYGDIAGPMNVKHVGAMETIRAHNAFDHADEPGRFVLGFIHTDRCRTDNAVTDPETIAAALAEAGERYAFYLDMTPDDDSWLVSFVMHSHPAVFNEAAEHIRKRRENRP